MKALLGTKLGMTQLFDESGNVARVTLIQAGPCTVSQVKTMDIDGYNAVQLGYGEEAQDTDLALEVGAKLDVTSFEVGDAVQVTGTSKGKGFAGTIKRHNFARGPKTHGSRNYREPGSIGAGYPEHVFRGMRMAGRMGGEQVTVKGLKVVVVDAEQNILAISGAVPGPKRGTVMVRGL
jgi:large subunit ribosomal protein L3